MSVTLFVSEQSSFEIIDQPRGSRGMISYATFGTTHLCTALLHKQDQRSPPKVKRPGVHRRRPTTARVAGCRPRFHPCRAAAAATVGAPLAAGVSRFVSGLMLSAKERSQKPSGVSAGRPFASVYLCLAAWRGVVYKRSKKICAREIKKMGKQNERGSISKEANHMEGRKTDTQ